MCSRHRHGENFFFEGTKAKREVATKSWKQHNFKMGFSFSFSSSFKLCIDLIFQRTCIRMNFKSYARIYGQIQVKSAIDSPNVAQKKQNGNKIHSFFTQRYVRIRLIQFFPLLRILSVTSDKTLRVSRENSKREAYL